MKTFNSIALAIGAAALLCIPASATTIIFSGNSSSSGLLTSLDNGTCGSQAGSGSSCVNGQVSYAVDTTSGFNLNGGSPDVLQALPVSGSNLVLTFATPQESVTIYFLPDGASSGSSGLLQAYGAGGCSISLNIVTGSCSGTVLGQVGYTNISSSPMSITVSTSGNSITYISIDEGNNSNLQGTPTVNIDEIVYSAAQVGAPEPATFGLIGVGLLGLGFMRRKRVRS